MLKTITYIGHNSRFGFACIEQLLQSTFFNIETIVIADFDRWNKFSSSLRLLEKPSFNIPLRQRNRKQIKALKQLLKNHPKINLRIIHDANSKNEIGILSNYDLIISAAFPQIFNKTFIEASKNGAINLHPSWLPYCRGAHPIYWTIFNSEEFGGLSAHFMLPEIDTGPIIAREKIVFNNTTIEYDQLYQKVINHIPALIKNMETFFIESKQAIKQDESQASYFRSDRLIHYKIFWKKETNKMISAKIRAGSAYTLRYKKQINLLPPFSFLQKTKFVSNNYDHRIEEGTIIHLDNDYLWIKLKDGYLKTQYTYKKNMVDRLIDFCKLFNVQTLIYRISFLDKERLKVGEILH